MHNPQFNYQKFAKFIRIWQIKNRSTVVQLAQLLETERSMLYKWQNGQVSPSMPKIAKIMEISDGYFSLEDFGV